METSGEWLRGQRTAHYLTREEFAKRVGCSVARLHKIENDERRASEQMADLIANCRDVPLTLSQIEAIQAQAGGKILEAVVADLLE